MTYSFLFQTKKPMLKALLITATLCLFWSFKPAFSLAGNSLISPTPNFAPPQVKGESTNDNLDLGSYANLGYPLVGLVFGSGVISGVVIYKRKNRKNVEEINFFDPQSP